MADEKLTSLTALDAFASGDLLYSVDDPAGTPVSKKATIDQAKQFIVGDGSVSVASGKTLTSSNTLTLAGTDGTTMTFPSTSSTVAGLGVSQTFTATQTITPAVNTSAVIGSGYSLTGSANASFMDLAGTWNTSGTPTAIKLNITDTASNAASLLMDLQVDGASRVFIDKSGRTYSKIPSSNASTNFSGERNATGNFLEGRWGASFIISAVGVTSGAPFVRVSSDGIFQWNSTTLSVSSPDLTLRRRGTANLQLGAADAAAPVAQTLSVQSVVAGTTNTAGANLTITGSQGTGTGAGGSIIFQVAPAGGSGTAQNALASAMVIDSAKTVRVGTGYTVATLPAAGTAGRRTYVTDATAPTFLGALVGGGSTVCPVFDNGTAWVSA